MVVGCYLFIFAGCLTNNIMSRVLKKGSYGV